MSESATVQRVSLPVDRQNNLVAHCEHHLGQLYYLALKIKCADPDDPSGDAAAAKEAKEEVSTCNQHGYKRRLAFACLPLSCAETHLLEGGVQSPLHLGAWLLLFMQDLTRRVQNGEIATSDFDGRSFLNSMPALKALRYGQPKEKELKT